MSTRSKSGSSFFATPAFRVCVTILLIALATLYALAQGNNGLWTRISPMPFASAGPTATLLGDNTVLVAGGTNGFDAFANRIASSALFFPNGNGWLPLPPMATARSYHGASIMPNGKVLVAGGYASVPPLVADLGGELSSPCGPGEGIARSGTASGAAEIFDETMLAWTPASPMNSARAEFSLVRMFNGMVLAAGGSGDSSAEFYNPAADTWTYTSSMQNFHLGAATTLLPDGRVFVGGGNIGSLLFGLGSCGTSAEVYDPNSDTWTGTGGMSKNRYHATASVVRLADNSWRVLVVGGADGNDPNLPSLATAELWDPTTNNFTPVASMATPRQFQSASVLPNGEVLVAGGINQPTGLPPDQASAEIYDPVHDTWRSGSTMTTARDSQTSTLFSTFPAKVLVAGGFSGANFLSSAEIFQPTPIATSTTLFADSSFSSGSAISSCQTGAVRAFVGSRTGLGVPTGTVTFSGDGGFLSGSGTLDGTGTAIFNVSLPPGTHVLQAHYGGDSAFEPSDSAVLLQDSVEPPIDVSGPSIAAFGAPVMLTASVPAGATAPLHFNWTPPAGSTAASCSPVTPGCFAAIPPALGLNLFTVTGTDANGCVLSPGSFTVNVLPAGVNLLVRPVALFRNQDGSISVLFTVTDQDADAATNLQATASTLGASPTSSALPMSLGNLPGGLQTAFVLSYPGNAVVPGAPTVLAVTLTYTDLVTGNNGSVNGNFRVTGP